MKKIKKIAILILLSVITTTTMFTSCESIANFRKTDEGALWLKSNDTYYIPCSVSVKAYAIGDLYGKVGDLELYEIQFEASDKFISEKENLLGGVYRRSDVPEITLGNFNAVAAQIYVIGEQDIIVGEFPAAPEYLSESLTDDYEDGTPCTNAVVDAILGDNIAIIPAQVDEDTIFHIRLLSPDYPGLTYTVIFMMDINGDCFLYDRSTQKCVVCPEIIKDKMIGTGDETSDISEAESEQTASE
ncbi:MAG: hypothetical protein A2Y17_01695 [Clostridiales bacterium GWF2_38_85]|nr:MAG: hypothetical protein A2Y17_01695 [Clostridiales bacterium GWF2_38_85]HBL84777.1 hypothetical protein [Clostridiales bacterium]